MDSTTPDFSTVFQAAESSLSKSIKFWLLLIGECISIPTYVFVIYQFVTRRTLYGALYNHVVIVNLFVALSVLLTDVVCHMIFLRSGRLFPSTNGMCLLWQYMDYGIWYADLSLKFWASIERHILIFHSTILNTKSRRLLFHYLPLVLFTLYCPLVYIYMILIYPTSEQPDFTVLFCAGPFFYFTIPPWFVWYESVVHYVTPIVFAMLITAALPLRVFLQKHRLHVGNSWRQYRKMTIQLLSIVGVYVFDLPYVFVTIVRWSGASDFATDLQAPYFYYCTFIPMMLFPFATIGSVPDVKRKLCDFLCPNWQRRTNTVVPRTLLQLKTQTIMA